MNAINFTPIQDRILIKRDIEEEKTQNGIYLPDSNKEKSNTGVIIKMGIGKRNQSGELIPYQVQIGQRVYFSKFSGLEVFNSEYLVMKEEEILGILE